RSARDARDARERAERSLRSEEARTEQLRRVALVAESERRYDGESLAYLRAALRPGYTPELVSSAERARLFDPEAVASQVLRRSARPAVNAAYSADGAWALVATNDQAELVAADTGDVRASLAWRESYITHAALSPDGARALTAEDTGLVTLWD